MGQAGSFLKTLQQLLQGKLRRLHRFHNGFELLQRLLEWKRRFGGCCFASLGHAEWNLGGTVAPCLADLRGSRGVQLAGWHRARVGADCRCRKWLLLFALHLLKITLVAAICTEVVEYRDGDTVLEVFVAWDDTKSQPQPGVVIVHQWLGLGAYEHKRARMLAELGYVAFVRTSTAKEFGLPRRRMPENWRANTSRTVRCSVAG